MSAKIIDGKVLSAKLLDEVSDKIEDLRVNMQRVPCLAVVLVGNDPASQVYVKNKKLACAKVGITSEEFVLSADTTQEKLVDLIHKLNKDINIDGILVQLPLPVHLNSKVIIDTISSDKDVDGFHRYNMGSLALNDPQISPCTPHGVMYMLDNHGVNYHGANVVIVGTSNIVGRPMALELINRGATVTMCNSKTTDLPSKLALADIVVAAVGRPNMIKGEWLKDTAIVIDVGINRLENGKLCGDVDFASSVAKVAAITPVPGGVGPMTIAMLMRNTLKCYQLHYKK